MRFWRSLSQTKLTGGILRERACTRRHAVACEIAFMASHASSMCLFIVTRRRVHRELSLPDETPPQHPFSGRSHSRFPPPFLSRRFLKTSVATPRPQAALCRGDGCIQARLDVGPASCLADAALPQAIPRMVTRSPSSRRCSRIRKG